MWAPGTWKRVHSGIFSSVDHTLKAPHKSFPYQSRQSERREMWIRIQIKPSQAMLCQWTHLKSKLDLMCLIRIDFIPGYTFQWWAPALQLAEHLQLLLKFCSRDYQHSTEEKLEYPACWFLQLGLCRLNYSHTLWGSPEDLHQRLHCQAQEGSLVYFAPMAWGMPAWRQLPYEFGPVYFATPDSQSVSLHEPDSQNRTTTLDVATSLREHMVNTYTNYGYK